MAKTSLPNRVPAAILRSPLHRLLSRTTLLLGFTGRRSGTRYATPVNYLRVGDELLVTTDSPWWRNLRNAAPVEVRLRGRSLAATASAVVDPEEVAAALTAIVRAQPRYGKWARVKVGPGGEPDAGDVRAEVARGRVLVRIRLGEVPPGTTHAS